MPEALRRTEAKAFFANERTFLHWMSMAVTIGSIAAALSGIAGHAHRHWGDDFTENAIVVRVLALIMLGIAIFIACFAGYNFNDRANKLETKQDGPYDSKVLPIVLAITLIASLVVVLAGAIARLGADAPAPAPVPAPA